MTTRRGFSLIEMLCAMALLAVIGLVIALLLKDTLEIERIQAEGFDKALQANALADQFRADVAQAENAPQEYLHYRAGADTLILKSQEVGHVVYTWREGKLTRHVFKDDVEAKREIPLASDRVAVEFVRGSPSPALLRVRLIALREGRRMPDQTLEIAAALGEDRR